MQAPLLQIQNLSIAFRQGTGWNAVVNGVNLQLHAGEALALVGESGSGKTVTALAITGLLQRGSAQVGAESSILFRLDSGAATELAGLPEPAFRKLRGKHIGFVFQEPMSALNPVLTCGMQVAEVLQRHEGLQGVSARKRVEELFDAVQLPRSINAWRAYPHQLSGGQKQRVMIAMAVACKPALLLCDEPTTALDVTVQKEILALLRQLQQEMGMGLLFISHDLAVVAQVAQHVAVMRAGRVVEQESISSILATPEHSYTQLLLRCARGEGSLLRDAPVKDVPPAVLLDVQQLTAEYTRPAPWFWQPPRKLTGIKDVSFTVNKHDVLGLVGESGSGKTTLSRVLLGLLPAVRGKVIFAGTDWAQLTRNQLRKHRLQAQLIFQDPMAALNPRHILRDSLMEPLRVHDLYGNDTARRDWLDDLLKRVYLQPELLMRYPHQLSGGQRQRMCIVRALALQPQLLILDEAVSALDVSLQAEVLALLAELKAALGLTYIFVTHDLGLVRRFCTQVLVLHQGRVVEQGVVERVLTAPSSLYTQALLEAVPMLQQ